MTFDEWYEQNAKYMNTTDFEAWMLEAWEAGAKAECEKLKNIAIYDMWLKERDLAIEDAVLAEREACAKVCDEPSYMQQRAKTSAECAAAIRSRGKK